MRFALSLLGCEVFAVELGSTEYEELPEEIVRLTTTDNSFGFAPEDEWWGDDEDA